jgi:hypothetical protein
MGWTPLPIGQIPMRRGQLGWHFGSIEGRFTSVFPWHFLLTHLNSSGTYFGSTGVQVNLANRDAADTYGVYAATEDGKLSVVIVNKDTKPLALNLSNLPQGSYFMRHFGGASGVAKWQVCL